MSGFFNQELRFGSHGEGITHAVQRLILFTTFVFAVQLLLIIPLGGMPVYFWLSFMPETLLKGFVWTPLTYMFLHGGLMHLFGNMLSLYIFGPTVERVLGTRQFYTFYLICGGLGVLLGTLPLVLFSLPANALILGASGATLGTLVASAILEPERKMYIIPFPFPITYRGILIVTVAFDVLRLVEGGSGVAVLTHFGGMLVAYGYMKGRPKWMQFQLGRKERRLRNKTKKTSAKQDELADAVDNIFDFKNKHR